MAKILVDKKDCIGCGACVAVAPGLFELDEDNNAESKIIGELNDEELTKAKEAEEICPVQAIKVE